MLPLWRRLGLKDPFICESGGAIYFPAGYFHSRFPGLKSKGIFEVLELGTQIHLLRRELAAAATDCGVAVRSFGDMSPGEIAALTGLTLDQAAQARQREYDEPFVVESGDAARLAAALQAKNLTVTKGDRFQHLTGGHSKGDAVETLLRHYRDHHGDFTSIGLGNSANDLPMLAQVNRPFLVKNPDGQWDPTVLEKIPAVERTQGIGPGGWSEAVDKVLAEFAA